MGVGVVAGSISLSLKFLRPCKGLTMSNRRLRSKTGGMKAPTVLPFQACRA